MVSWLTCNKQQNQIRFNRFSFVARTFYGAHWISELHISKLYVWGNFKCWESVHIYMAKLQKIASNLKYTNTFFDFVEIEFSNLSIKIFKLRMLLKISLCTLPRHLRVTLRENSSFKTQIFIIIASYFTEIYKITRFFVWSKNQRRRSKIGASCMCLDK